MRSPIASVGPDTESRGGPESLANLPRGTAWIEQAGRLLDRQRVRTFRPEHPEYGPFLVSTGREPRLLGMTWRQLEASDEPPARVEPADPKTLAEIKA